VCSTWGRAASPLLTHIPATTGTRSALPPAHLDWRNISIALKTRSIRAIRLQQLTIHRRRWAGHTLTIATWRTPPWLLSGWECRFGVFPESEEIPVCDFGVRLPETT